MQNPSPSLPTPFHDEIRPGIALCLSGGGYRAMLYHLGTLRALNQRGWLVRLTRVSSVSGGSIVAGLLGLRWRELAFDADGIATRFSGLVEQPILALASRTLDWKSAALGLLPFTSGANQLSRAYDRHLFKGATLQGLPDDYEGPRFVINAANLQTGVLFRFSRPYMADYKLGMWKDPVLPLAQAVAASSAFPPILSPMRLKAPAAPQKGKPTLARGNQGLQRELRRNIRLTDGGVYDNFGHETAHKFRCVLVSDGGKRLQDVRRGGLEWFGQLLRVRAIFDDQVRALRTRWLERELARGHRLGAYFSIQGELVTRSGRHTLPEGPESRLDLADIDTRLARMTQADIDALVAWGERQASRMLDALEGERVTPDLAHAPAEAA